MCVYSRGFVSDVALWLLGSVRFVRVLVECSCCRLYQDTQYEVQQRSSAADHAGSRCTDSSLSTPGSCPGWYPVTPHQGRHPGTFRTLDWGNKGAVDALGFLSDGSADQPKVNCSLTSTYFVITYQ